MEVFRAGQTVSYETRFGVLHATVVDGTLRIMNWDTKDRYWLEVYRGGHGTEWVTYDLVKAVD